MGMLSSHANQADQQRLWTGLSDGTIQVIGISLPLFMMAGIRSNTKVAGGYSRQRVAKTISQKYEWAAAVGDRLQLWTYAVREKRLTPNQFVRLTSTNPAKIFGLYPRKGALLRGSDADILLWDPEIKVTYGLEYSHHRTDYNLFEGWPLVGLPHKVFLRGNLIVDGRKWLGRAGMGSYIHRQPGLVLS
jgi:dihydropyrimidinase